jgi:RNA polymerase-binding transcription factor DksA
MDSTDDNLSDGLSLSEVYESKKEENKKKSASESARKYFQKPEVKARITAQRQAKVVKERLKRMDQDQHLICKKLGKPMGHARTNPNYFYRCRQCEKSFSEKQKNYFYKGNRCPCCHLMLRIRKTVTQKRKLV